MGQGIGRPRSALQSDQASMGERFASDLKGKTDNITDYLVGVLDHTEIIKVVLRHSGTVLADTVQNKASTNMFRAQLLLEWWHARDANKREEAVPMSRALVKSLMDMFDSQWKSHKFQDLNFSNLDYLGMGESGPEDDFADDDSFASLEDDAGQQGQDPAASLSQKDLRRQEQLDLLHTVLSNVTESPHFLDQDTFFVSDEDIRNVQSKVAATHMALRMGRNRDGHRPVIVGQESIGKSTFINFLVRPTGNGESALPVASGMGTAMLTIVKHGDAEVCIIDDKVVTASSTVAALTDANAKAQKARNQKKTLSKSSISKLITPFARMPSQPIELVDVPGLKDETRHENCLAFGASSCIVLCAGSAKDMKDALHEYELKEMRDMYDDLGTTPPILCCVTKESRAKFNEAAYEDVIRGAFRGVKQVKVMFANCIEAKSTGGQEAVDEIVNTFFKSVFDFANPVKDLDKAFNQLRIPLSNVFAQIDATVKRNDGCKPGDGNFNRAYTAAMDQVKNGCMKNMRELAPNRGWISEKNPSDIVRQAGKREVPNLKFFTIVAASGRELATAADRLFIIENVLMDFRIALYSAALKVGAQMFSWLWDSCKPILTHVMFNQRTLAQKYEDTAKKKLNNYRTFTERSLPQMLTESVHDSARQDITRAPSGLGTLGGEDAELSLAEWEAQSTASIEYFSDRGRTPWLMVGYYGCVTDWKLKTELLEEEVTSAVRTKTDLRNMADFPISATLALRDFQKVFMRQLQQMREAEAKQDNPETGHNVLVGCCIETAEFVASNLNSSKLLSMDSPLASTMIELAYAMLQRLLLTYDSGVTWTSFGQELVRSHRAPEELIKAASGGPHATIAFERAAKLMESEMASDAEQASQSKANKQMESLLGKFTARQRAMQTLSNGSECVLVVTGAPLTDSTLADMEKALKKHSPNIKPRFKMCNRMLKKNEDLAAVEQEMQEAGAGIVVLVRASNLHSDDPQSTELKYCEKLQGILTVSTLVVVSRRDCASKSENFKKWQAALKEDKHGSDEINFVPLAHALEESGDEYVLSDDALETLAREVAEGWDEIETRIATRRKRVEEEQATFRLEMTRIIKDYVDLKDVVPDATELYNLFKQNRDVGKADSKWGAATSQDACKLVVPKDEKLFATEPFVEEIVATLHEQKVRNTKELAIRQFFFRLLLTQVMSKAKTVGERVYNDKVKEAFKRLVPKTFGITVPQFMSALQKQVDKAEVSAAGIVEDPDSIPALFLHRDHFVNMFVGGAVLAVCPLLHGILLPRLKPEDKAPPTSSEFDEHKRSTLDYFVSLTKFGADGSMLDRALPCFGAKARGGA